ncbi:MAG: methyltransferase domain-containing protein, partial [Silvanigrellaceae bacterium]|nr:methyltransferase domain-containing protein [Silvanigrellaceae bacterium]
NRLTIKRSAQSYHFTNPAMMENIYARILEIADLTRSESMLHVYSGVGALCLALAAQAKSVVGIDESVFNTRDAEKNAKINNVKNVNFYHGKVEALLPQMVQDKLLSKEQDLIVLSPLHGSVSEQTIFDIVFLKPKKIIYLTSSPKKLVSQLSMFYREGYKALFFEIFDTYPGTNRYEVLCYFEKME